MPYRRTENVSRRLAARHAAIIAAARQAASEGGMAAVQIAPMAERAGIAAGTVYRYFPGKTDLVAAVLGEVSKEEIAALRTAAARAPGALSALAAAIMTFAARALRQRRLLFAAIAEPVDVGLGAVRLTFRNALAAEFAKLIGACRPATARAGRRTRQCGAARGSGRGTDRSASARGRGPRARTRPVADADRAARARRRRCARPRAGDQLSGIRGRGSGSILTPDKLSR